LVVLVLYLLIALLWTTAFVANFHISHMSKTHCGRQQKYTAKSSESLQSADSSRKCPIKHISLNNEYFYN